MLYSCMFPICRALLAAGLFPSHCRRWLPPCSILAAHCENANANNNKNTSKTNNNNNSNVALRLR